MNTRPNGSCPSCGRALRFGDDGFYCPAGHEPGPDFDDDDDEGCCVLVYADGTRSDAA